MMQLRPYQVHLEDGARDLFLLGHRAVLLVAPTGGGKTVVFSHMGAAAAKRNRRVLVLVHRIELVRQTLRKVAWTGVNCGVIQRKFKADLSAHLQIASVQTIAKRLDKIPYQFDLIIVDEAHHAPAGTWSKIIAHYPQARILGVTATPIRTDGAGLDGIFDAIHVGPQYEELINDGYLVRPLVLAPKNKIDLTDIKMRMGDYDTKQLEKEFDKPNITGDAVAHYTKVCAGKPAVVFCISVDHAEHVAQLFRDAGYRAVAVDGNIDDETREKILGDSGQLATGEIQVVTSCSLISEGTDIPNVYATIHLRPTQSLSLWLQQTGRGSRPVYAPGFDLDTREGRLAAIAASDKPKSIVLDHAGNCFIHGMPDEPREWSLVGFKEAKQKRGDRVKVEKVKQCNKCYGIHKPADTCPHCGYIYPALVRTVDEKEGELEEIASDEMKKFISQQARHEVQKMKTLEQLEEYGRKKGYKPNWAKHVFAARNRKQTGI